MSSRIMNVADGGNGRTACPGEVFYHQYCLAYIQATSISTVKRGVSSIHTICVSQPSVHPSQR